MRATFTLPFLLLSLPLGACDIYPQRDGEFSAGPVDTVSFPPGYLGSGGDRTRSGKGTITEIRAYAKGQPIGYFSFPFSTGQVGPPVVAGSDPVRLVDKGAANPKVPAPVAYHFDPASPCTPPPGYLYDPQRDEVHYDEQGNLFTAVPQATYTPGALPSWNYIPVVREVTVAEGGARCQDVKSEPTLLARKDVTIGMPSGNYLAWAMIDPAAGVYRLGQTPTNNFGWGTQKIGWFNHYLVAYLDGGTVPVLTSADKMVVRMQTQNLYYPRSKVLLANGTTVTGGLGFGYDVLEAPRGDGNYSPVCAVLTYDTGGVTPIDQLPKSAAVIEATFDTLLPPVAPAPSYVYCLQVK